MINEQLDKEILEYTINKNTGKIITQRCTESVFRKRNYYDYLMQRYSDNSSDSVKESYYRLVHNIDVRPTCKICGKPLEFKVNDARYQGIYCSRKCQNSDPDMIAVNAVNVSKALKRVYKERGDSVKEKRKATLSKKYGTEGTCSPFAYKEVQNKVKSSIKEKYGVDNILQLKEFRGNTKEIFRNKSISLWKERGYDISYTDNDTVIIKNGCSVHGDIELDLKTFCNRMKADRRETSEICPICNKIHYLSGHEVMLKKFLDDNNIECITNDRKIINPLELDFYIPAYNLAIEVNGIYFHGEYSAKPKDYHKHKTELCNEKGIQLIHIWENDWITNKDLIISMLKSKLNLSGHKVGARECEIKNVSSKDAREFLEYNHLQGAINSKYRFGLYYKNELVSLMTFGNLRVSVGMKSNKTTCELYRFCNKRDWNIQGGASKLFKHAINILKNEGFKEIITFAKRDWSNGDLYNKIGFINEGYTEPGYFWVNTHGQKLSRYSCRKSNIAKTDEEKKMTEVEIMHNRGFFRCYDSGNIKFKYTIQ